jgi:hypothetical protein
MWSDNPVLAVGDNAVLRFANAAPATSVSVTGGARATMQADSNGAGSTSYTAKKAGVISFIATYTIKLGKKNFKSTTSTKIFVPLVRGPACKLKAGRAGKFTLTFAPPGSTATVVLGDGQRMATKVDPSGNASFAPVFLSPGGVLYTISVDGTQVASGGLTINR